MAGSLNACRFQENHGHRILTERISFESIAFGFIIIDNYRDLTCFQANVANFTSLMIVVSQGWGPFRNKSSADCGEPSIYVCFHCIMSIIA